MILRERTIPIGVLAWESALDSIGAQAWNRTFYRTVMAADQDEATRTLHGGLWTFVADPDTPGFSGISDQEAWRFYRRIGGTLTSEDHFRMYPIRQEFKMAAGRSSTYQLTHEGGGGGNAWWLLGTLPTWLTIGFPGLITADPPRGTTYDHTFSVMVRDENEVTAGGSLRVLVGA